MISRVALGDVKNTGCSRFSLRGRLAYTPEATTIEPSRTGTGGGRAFASILRPCYPGVDGL
jgi:hypothetical protein